MKVNILGIIKGVSELAVSAGVGVVVGNMVKATTPYDLNKFQKVMVAVGGFGLSGVLGDLSAKHISKQIDGYAERVNEIFHPSQEVKEAAEDVVEHLEEAADAATEVVKKVAKPSAPAED